MAVTGCVRLATLLVTAAAASLAQQQCSVSVLYESHCPDSRNFIHRELVPIWNQLEPTCTLDLVPFGKARSTSTGFDCQHGPKECKGNMIMSCALSRLEGSRKQLDFTSCFMADPDYGGEECAAKQGLVWDDINTCMVSGEGTNLQKEAERKSFHIQRSRFVPTVVINNQYNQVDQNDVQRGNFEDVMCRHLPPQTLTFCSK